MIFKIYIKISDNIKYIQYKISDNLHSALCKISDIFM